MSIHRLLKALLKIKTCEKFPVEVLQTITARCNLNCRYCIYPMIKSEMTTQQIKRAIKEFAEEGTLSWTISGGEPLLRTDLKEIIMFAKDCGISRVKVLTNGLLFKQKLETLKKADEIAFSLDGPKEIHDKIRGKNSC